MPGRYTAGERAQFAANRRAAAAGAKYGHTSYADRGLRPEKEKGQAFLKRAELQAQFGAFANPTWQYEVRGGQVYRKPLPGQAGRIHEQGGTAQWELAPDYVQRSYSNPQRQAFFAQHPDLANRPGGGQDAWLHQRYLNSLQTDPTTGWAVNQAGELYDPSNYILTGVRREAPSGPGQMPSQFGPKPPMTGGGFMGPGQPPMTGGGFMGPGFGGGFGGYGQPGGYIPGYAMPFSMPNYNVPGMQGGSLGQLGQQPMNQAPGIQRPNYRTMQQAGGSSFGSYPQRFGPTR